MTKKVIRNTFLILLIPIFITLIIYFMYSRKLDNVFYDPINYETNNSVVISDNNENTTKLARANTSDLNDYSGLITGFNKNYKIYLYLSITMVIFLFFVYTTAFKNKK